MDFNLYVNRVDTMYMTLLETGGQDTVALKIGIETALEALEKMPDALLAKLNPAQQRHRESLLLFGPQLVDKSIGPKDSREWFETARSLLIRLPS